MAVSPKKTTHSRQGKRRSHHFIRNVNVAFCQNCGESKKSHSVCLKCGQYKGKQVLEVSEK